jgi:hypothetical protein
VLGIRDLPSLGSLEGRRLGFADGISGEVHREESGSAAMLGLTFTPSSIGAQPSPRERSPAVPDSGSRMGAAARTEARSGAVSVAGPRPVSWEDIAYQAVRTAACSVRIEVLCE